MDELSAWVWLNRAFKLDTKTILDLIQQFGSASRLLSAKHSDFVGFPKLEIVNRLLREKRNTDFLALSDEVRRLQYSGIHIIRYCDQDYPVLLKDTQNPPLTIFHRGELVNFEKCVAVVGTRRLSHYGHKKARESGQELANGGYTVVSGLARGTDTEAHCGALDVGGKTIAVLAGNIENIYPEENKVLAEDITRNGAILSEKSSLERTTRDGFVQRNRITSGISICLVVIESDGTGGTKHQVDFALNQGRKVFIMRPIEGKKNLIKGFNQYVKAGGIPFDSPSEVIYFLKNRNLKPGRESSIEAPSTLDRYGLYHNLRETD